MNPSEALALHAAYGAANERRQIAGAQGKTIDYTIKAGDHLYQIIRGHLGIQEERKVAQYFRAGERFKSAKN